MPLTRRFRNSPILLALLVPCAIVLAWMVARAQPDAQRHDEAPAKAQPAIPVVLAEVTQATNTADIEALGSGVAARSVTLFPAVAGEVAEVRFKSGQRVKAQDILLRLDDRNQRLQVDLAAARLDAAKRLRARYESTRGTGAVPGSLIDEAESGVRLAEIALRQAREALADRVLRAPFSGVVGLAEVEPGDRVSTDTAITTLDDRRSLQVAFELPEAYAARLAIGQKLAVSNPAFANKKFDGAIALIDSRVNETSRSLRIRATVPNPDDVLRPGMSFQVQLTLPGERYPVVPELALQWGRDGSYVWLARDGKSERVAVRSVRRTEGRVLVDGDLRAGEQVVVEGVQRLNPGRPIDPVETEVADASDTQAGKATSPSAPSSSSTADSNSRNGAPGASAAPRP